MTNESNRPPPARKAVNTPNTGGSNHTATGQGPRRNDNEPQVAPESSPQANDRDPPEGEGGDAGEGGA